jgi:hypothetical protein
MSGQLISGLLMGRDFVRNRIYGSLCGVGELFVEENLDAPGYDVGLLRRCGEEDIHRVVIRYFYARPEIVTGSC